MLDNLPTTMDNFDVMDTIKNHKELDHLEDHKKFRASLPTHLAEVSTPNEAATALGLGITDKRSGNSELYNVYTKLFGKVLPEVGKTFKVKSYWIEGVNKWAMVVYEVLEIMSENEIIVKTENTKYKFIKDFGVAKSYNI